MPTLWKGFEGSICCSPNYQATEAVGRHYRVAAWGISTCQTRRAFSAQRQNPPQRLSSPKRGSGEPTPRVPAAHSSLWLVMGPILTVCLLIQDLSSHRATAFYQHAVHHPPWQPSERWQTLVQGREVGGEVAENGALCREWSTRWALGALPRKSTPTVSDPFGVGKNKHCC